MAKADWQKIEEIFGRAIELPLAGRDAYLAKACGSDEDLRKEIEKLLLADEKAADFIASPALASASLEKLPEGLEDSISPSLLGKKVGNYRLISEIGRGGMGAVYLAERDDEEFKKRVAIKLIKRGMDTDFILKRFRHERQILATLEHPNIARLLDGGTTGDGLPFFVMEYIEGQNIGRFCKEKKLSIRERLQIFLQVCAAVGYAHQNGIIHRDLKPGNILVTKEGTPKLLDFGIAKILDSDLAGSTIEPTASLLRLMTPEYASPEQIRGEALTASSDIYSLGVLLFELLTGKRPYKFPSRAPHEIARVICEEEPLLPSEVKRGKASQKEGRIDEGLDSIIFKALSKKASERYKSIEGLSDDIRHYLDGLPISAPLPDSMKTAAKGPSEGEKDTAEMELAKTGELAHQTASTHSYGNWFGLNRRSIFAMVLLLALAGLSFAAYYFISNRNSSAEIDSIAVLPFKNTGSGDLEYLSDGIAESLISSLSNLKGMKVIARSSVFHYKGKEIDPQAIGREMNVRAILTGEIIQRGDKLIINAELVDTKDNRRLWGEQYNRKLDDLVSIQEDIARQMSRKLKATLSKSEEDLLAKRSTENPEAYQLYLKGRFYWNKRTLEANQAAIDYFRQAVKADPDFALAYAGIADCYIVAFGYQFMDPNEALEKAKEAVKEALKLNDSLGEAHASLAYIEGFGFSNYEEADREFAAALELNPNYATGHQWYAMFLAALGRRSEALREIGIAISLDPVSLIINSDAVLVYYFTGEYDLGLAQCRKVLELDKDFWLIHGYQGLIYIEKGMHREAIDEWKAVLLSHPGDISIKAALGHGLAISGKKEEALAILEKLKKQSRHGDGLEEARALILKGLGRNDEAIALLESRLANGSKLGIFTKADPRWQDLRHDKRFEDLMRRAGFPQ